MTLRLIREMRSIVPATRWNTRWVILIALLTVPVPHAAASDLVVIANPDISVSEISLSDLRAVFLGTRTSLRGAGQVQPVLKKSGAALTEFSMEYLGKTASGLLIYYRSLVFSGKWSMPVTLESDAEMAAYVANTRGAIGFVRDASAAHGVKTLKVMN